MAQQHFSSFPCHPPDHPLWRDVNFCPREVYTELILPLVGAKRTTEGARKGSVAAATAAPIVSRIDPVTGMKKRGRPPKIREPPVINAETQPPLATPPAAVPGGAAAPSIAPASIVELSSPVMQATGAWNDDEDSLLVFQQSDQGRELRISYDDVAEHLGRSGNAVKCRWHAQVKKLVETLGPDEYRVMLEKGEKKWFSKSY